MEEKKKTNAGAVITGAPTLASDVLYVPVSSVEEVLAIDPRYSCCTFRGLIAALDALDRRGTWARAMSARRPSQSA